MPERSEGETGREAAMAWLRAELAAMERAGGPERRHEVLLERARDWGLTRPDAEAGYALAEDTGLEPELALLLLRSGLGVTEVEPVAADPEEPGQEQSPPGWVRAAAVPPEAARRERRLRLSFRRLNSLLAGSGSAAEAVERFASEPDVVEGAY